MKYIHIVSFDVPYPPDYGGIVAVHKLIELFNSRGIKVILHVFIYNNKIVLPKLEMLCYKVIKYKRKTGFISNASMKPYIVNSRRDPQLLKNLLADSYPVLLEGIQSTYYLSELVKTKKNVFVRAHNIEWQYYKSLALSEKSFLKKLFFKIESFKLQHYENRNLRYANKVFCFTENDGAWFKSHGIDAQVVNPVLSNLKVNTVAGMGKAILIHGNLSVNDMVNSIKLILEQFQDDSKFQFIIAGKNPSRELHNFLAHYSNVKLVENPNSEELKSLILDAQINLCYSEIREGFKMRLLPLLEYGRYILCNHNFCSDQSLLPLLLLEDDLKKWPKIAVKHLNENFTSKEIQQRQELLDNISLRNGLDSMIMSIFDSL